MSWLVMRINTLIKQVIFRQLMSCPTCEGFVSIFNKIPNAISPSGGDYLTCKHFRSGRRSSGRAPTE